MPRKIVLILKCYCTRILFYHPLRGHILNNKIKRKYMVDLKHPKLMSLGFHLHGIIYFLKNQFVQSCVHLAAIPLDRIRFLVLFFPLLAGS